ncbi:helix-turn-helix transcriptional regulator [Actinocatenispora rupis]|uniref:Transcriptional regulator n=1 Tax=Actinocatenispora rupis TaxID=519421 RepID=A0A8J3NC95_9ACTN|nr:helix-turn-helix transcriptional regulator [Actinocatenispora rupis]GID11645.1 transcriptional regulator [Actinocatenispora rupis]
MDRAELADFLRLRRARIQPADVGLPPGNHRRTPGLRREEVAHLAGMSVDYYVRLEQARGPHPSEQVLDALSRALRLSEDERRHLFHLAARTPGPGAGPRRDVPAGILRLLDRLDDTPAMVVDAKSDILAWNPMLCATLGRDLAAYPERERNGLRWLFQPGGTETADRVTFAREMVADLRAAAARYPDDASIRELVADLAGHPLFDELWAAHEVDTRRSTSKLIRHPTLGTFEVDCQTLDIPERDQRLIFYTAAPGTPGYEALGMVRVIGTADLATR